MSDCVVSEGSISVPKPRTLKQFKRHIRKLNEKNSSSGKDGFEEEFNAIEKQSENDFFKADFTCARLPTNRIKNRYVNVLPFEHTRVHLPKFPGETGSDFINANYIDGDGQIPYHKRWYIAAQGPLKDTAADFWRMVWNEMATIIVMLTKIVENEKQVKCDQYWPKKGCKRYGEFFLVSSYSPPLLDTEELVLQKIRLDFLPSGASRDLFHIQYREWPDFGLPKSTEKFREMLDIVDRFDLPSSPIVVHCSAGIGRTGTFCTVHSNLAKLKHFHSTGAADLEKLNLFDVSGTVAKLRRERIGMVQTKEQYTFCYYAILEGATAYHRMIKERKNIDKDFFPLSPNGHQVIEEILKNECSLPLEYEEARRVRFPNRNPYGLGFQEDDKKKGKAKLKKASKKKKGKREKSDSSSSSDDEYSPNSRDSVDSKAVPSSSSSSSSVPSEKSKSLNLDKKKKKDNTSSPTVDRKKKTKSSQIYQRL